jgi:hypothetical protein
METQASTTPFKTQGNAFKGLMSMLNKAIDVKTYFKKIRNETY